MPLLIPPYVYHRIVFLTVLRPTLAAGFSVINFAVTQGPEIARNILFQSVAYYGTASTLATVPPLIPVMAKNQIIQQYAALSPENGLTAELVFISAGILGAKADASTNIGIGCTLVAFVNHM